MEGFVINIIATAPFSVGFLAIFFFIYYFYLKGNGEDVRGEGKDEGKNKRLGKRLGKRILK